MSFPTIEMDNTTLPFASAPGESYAEASKMYRSIAAATTFSPRFHAVLGEASRVARYFGVSLQLIHVGEETPEKKLKIGNGLRAHDIIPETRVHWVPGEPATTISRVAADNGCDLVVAGAVHDDAGYRPFANNIARKLLAEAPMDLFLFLQPEENHRRLQCPAVIVDFSETSAIALRETMRVAKIRGAEKLHALHILTTFDEHRQRAAGEDGDAQERLDQFVMASTDLDLPVETRCIRGNTGFAACEYLQSIGADLLAVPTKIPGKSDQVLSAGLDWLFQVIPCNLWVMRERE